MKTIFRFLFLAVFMLSADVGLFAQDEADNGATPVVRSFDAERLEAYYNDTNYSYGKKFRLAQKKQELNDAFWASVDRFFSKKRIGSASLKGMLLALVVIATVFFVTLSLLGVNVRRLFKKRAQEIGIHDEELAEDLRELNFDELLTQASKKGNYRRGVRLLYLETLKMLTERNFVRYAKHKTNYEYLLSLQGHPLYQDFELLTLKFDYVWYGNFDIDEAGFEKMSETFKHFQSNISRSASKAIPTT